MVADDELEAIRRRKMAELMSQAFLQLPDQVLEVRSEAELNQNLSTYRDTLVVIDFWAEWCQPCKAFAPIYDAVYRELSGRDVVFMKVNVDQLPQVAGRFGVQGIPTTGFVHQGKMVHRSTGALPKPQFKSVVEQVLAATAER